MPINLLPEELREEKKKPKKVEKKEKVEMRKPPQEEPLLKKERKKAWFGFLRKKSAPPKPPEKPLEKPPEKPPEEKIEEKPPELPLEPPLQPQPEAGLRQRTDTAPSTEEAGPPPTEEERIPELSELLAEEPEKAPSPAVEAPLPPPAEAPAKRPKLFGWAGRKKPKILLRKMKVGEEAGPPSPEISLMPVRAVIIPRLVRDRFIIFLAGVIVILTIFGISWAYINWHFEKLGMKVDQFRFQMKTVEAQISPLLKTRNEMAKLESKVSKIEGILAGHIYWTKFFELLETYTIPDVYFGDFSADTNGTICLTATAKTLISAARQLVAFQNAQDFVKSARVSNVGFTPAGISFSIDLTLIEGVFLK